MEDNQDLIILEAGVLEDTEDQIEAETLETTEEEEEDTTTEMAAEIATADVADGNTVKLKDLNIIINSR